VRRERACDTPDRHWVSRPENIARPELARREDGPKLRALRIRFEQKEGSVRPIAIAISTLLASALLSPRALAGACEHALVLSKAPLPSQRSPAISAESTLRVGVSSAFITAAALPQIASGTFHLDSKAASDLSSMMNGTLPSAIGMNAALDLLAPAELANDVASGHTSFALVSAFEYPAMAAVDPRLEPLVFGTNDAALGPTVSSHVLVQKEWLDAHPELAATPSLLPLRCARLSVAPARPWSVEFLRRELAAEGASLDGFFAPSDAKERDNVEDAIDDLISGDRAFSAPLADLAIVDDFAWQSYQSLKPGRAKRVSILLSSAPVPAPMIVYDPATLDARTDATLGANVGAGPFEWPKDDSSIVSLFTGRMLGTAYFRSVNSAYQNAFWTELGVASPLASATLPSVGATADEAAAATRYTLELDGWNGDPDVPTASHTFAIFVATRDGEAPSVHTISWLPEDTVVPALSLRKGRNFTADETRAIANGRPIQVHGPYAITRATYERALARIAFLESGGAQYKMIDWKTRAPALENRAGGAVNCIHAVSDVVGPLDTGDSWGEAATQEVVDFFVQRGAMLSP
jgi:hypothetical protein